MPESFSHTNVLTISGPHGAGEKYVPGDDSPSPFLRELETQMERFLDIYCIIQNISLHPATEFFSGLAAEKETPAGSGFAITFPCENHAGILIVAHSDDILPEWYKNPGVAGKSRLALFAGDLSELFSKNSSIFHKSRESVSDFRFSSDISHFLTTEKYFAGRVNHLEALCRRLVFAEDASLAAFRVTRFDGSPGNAWLFAGVKNPEILWRFSKLAPSGNEAKGVSLKPVRSLEMISVSDTEEKSAHEIPAEEKTSTEDTPPAELFVQIPDDFFMPMEFLAAEPEAERHETFILPETPELAAMNTEEIRYVEEDRLFPVQPERFLRDLADFLRPRKENFPENPCIKKCVFQKSVSRRRMNRVQKFFENAHPRISRRWRRCRYFFWAELSRKTYPEAAEEADACSFPADAMFRKIPVTLHVSLGRKILPLEMILALKEGSVLTFGPAGDAPVEIFVSDQKIADGVPILYEGYAAVEAR